MSVISGENLTPPVFNNAITTNLVNIPVTSVSLNTTPVVYFTPTLQQGSTYLIIVNLLISDYNSYILETVISGNISGDTYTIAGNNLQFYSTSYPPSTYIVAENTTFQSVIPISPPSTQTYSITISPFQSLIPLTTPSINGTGSFIQILQLS